MIATLYHRAAKQVASSTFNQPDAILNKDMVSKAITSRTQNRLSRILWVCFFGILILLPIHAFLSTWLGTSVGPLLLWKSWKELLLVALLPLTIIVLIKQKEVLKTLWSRPINKLIILFSVIMVVCSIFSSASRGAVIAGMSIDLRFFAIFLLAQLLMEIGAAKINRERVSQRLFDWQLWVMLVLGVFAILQVYVIPRDFLTHFGYSSNTIAPYELVDQNQHALRAFATMRGPNTLGSYLLLPLAISFYGIIKRRNIRLSATSFLLGTVALILTDSRSAWIGACIVFVVELISLFSKKQLIRWGKIAAIPVIILLLIFSWAATSIPSLRLAIFHSDVTQNHSLTQGSDQKHAQATITGIQSVLHHPLGEGVGTSGPASFYNDKGPNIPENFFVQIGQETGWLGLALFIGITILLLKELFMARKDIYVISLLASFLGLTVINLFLHGWADDPTSMTWWGIAGIILKIRDNLIDKP